MVPIFKLPPTPSGDGAGELREEIVLALPKLTLCAVIFIYGLVKMPVTTTPPNAVNSTLLAVTLPLIVALTAALLLLPSARSPVTSVPATLSEFVIPRPVYKAIKK